MSENEAADILHEANERQEEVAEAAEEKKLVSEKTKLATFAGIMAVLSILSGFPHEHMNEEGIATDIAGSSTWSYYDYLSNEIHMDNFELVQFQLMADKASGSDLTLLQGTMHSIAADNAKHTTVMKQLNAEATAEDSESAHDFKVSDVFSVPTLLFSIAIVLASICMIWQDRWILLASRTAAGGGIIGLLYGAFVLLS
jgi:hypothetical protein